MIVRNLKELNGTEREVVTPGWTSKRILLKKDGMGFSLHETVIKAGADLPMHYKHHQEAVFIVSGEGTLTDLDNNKEYALAPGVMYALDGHERHILRARTEIRTICVFNPPVTGQEVHGADGAYPVDSDKAA